MKRNLMAAALLGTLALVGCDRVDPDSPQGKRSAIFKEMLKVSEDLGGMLRGRLAFDAGRFAEGAVELESLSRQPWQYFPHEGEDGSSSARDDVWARQERFQELAQQMEAATAALVAASGQTPLTPAQVGPALQQVEDGCEACHREFRVY
ncbi:c-type cytochrome [Stutzerimonas azotifigens]|uniref:Cytochrome c n=1 Tax=Stutzerimonas azotifigens TaxID=291995 RepID=A0ABR5Z0B6_9GAMM|nr:cytochrome c [Stutzerimonas azotifigens]MBA1273646.1 cytochrome c [Stutzerimonas azotifigens]